jgi:hypothetical protein
VPTRWGEGDLLPNKASQDEPVELSWSSVEIGRNHRFGCLAQRDLTGIGSTSGSAVRCAVSNSHNVSNGSAVVGHENLVRAWFVDC